MAHLTEQAAAALAVQLREYASNPGYSHQDYADTMRQAADELERGEAKAAAARKEEAEKWVRLVKFQRETMGTMRETRAITQFVNGATHPASEPLTKAQIDAIVYQCRQSGDDSTYAIVNAAISASAPAANLEGWEVSMDVSTGEDDFDHRIFGRVIGVQEGAAVPTILAEEVSRNFASAPAAAGVGQDWTVSHNGQTVSAATLTQCMAAARKLRTPEEEAIAAARLFAAIAADEAEEQTELAASEPAAAEVQEAWQARVQQAAESAETVFKDCCNHTKDAIEYMKSFMSTAPASEPVSEKTLAEIDDEVSERFVEPVKADAQSEKYRAEFLALAEACGMQMTGKPDGSEPITMVFTIDAWRRFDLATQPAAGAVAEDAARLPQEVIAWHEAEAERIEANKKLNMAIAASREFEFGSVNVSHLEAALNSAANKAHALRRPMYDAITAARAAIKQEGE